MPQHQESLEGKEADQMMEEGSTCLPKYELTPPYQFSIELPSESLCKQRGYFSKQRKPERSSEPPSPNHKENIYHVTLCITEKIYYESTSSLLCQKSLIEFEQLPKAHTTHHFRLTERIPFDPVNLTSLSRMSPPKVTDYLL